MRNGVSTRSPPVRKRMSPGLAGLLSFWHLRPERRRCLALLPRGLRRVLADAYGTAKRRPTRCWIGEGQLGAPEEQGRTGTIGTKVSCSTRFLGPQNSHGGDPNRLAIENSLFLPQPS